MTLPPGVPDPPPRPALRMRQVVAAVVVGFLAVVLAVLADWLLFRPADSAEWADVIRSTALALAFMAAVPAGYVAYRRQQTAEAEHKTAEAEHQLDQRKEERRQTELDDANVRAAAKDFRDRYTAAATQLGSDKAPIRLAGVYALAQLADEWGRTEPDQRQTCIDVLCSYLRMPWPLTAPDDASDQDKLDKNRLREEETRVRETILRVITAHLHTDRSPENGWHHNDFDFTGAELPAIDMTSSRLEGAFKGDRALFSGAAWFGRATFSGAAWFNGALFSGDAWFGGVMFSEGAWFNGALFSGAAWFGRATFSGDTGFNRATFGGAAVFSGATFSGDARFAGASFTQPPSMEETTISGVLVRTDGTEDAPSGELRPFRPYVAPVIVADPDEAEAEPSDEVVDPDRNP